MSIQKLDQSFIQKYLKGKLEGLEYEKSLLSKPVVSVEGRASSYHLASLNATIVGLWYILAGNYKEAQNYFHQALDFQKRGADLLEFRESDLYVYALRKLQVSILTLDKTIIENVAKELESKLNIPISQWKFGRQWYAVAKSLVGVILHWNKERLESIKFESKSISKQSGLANGSLGVLWAISSNNLEEFKSNFKRVVAFTRHENARRSDLPGHYISIEATIFIIVAQLKGFDLQDFDPPMVPMDYVCLIKNASNKSEMT